MLMKYEKRKELGRQIIKNSLRDGAVGVRLPRLNLDVFEGTALGEIFVMRYLKLLEQNGIVVFQDDGERVILREHLDVATSES